MSVQMLPTEHTVPPVDVPSQKTSFVACYTAHASDIKAMNHVGNDYRWGKENKLAIIVIIRSLRKQK